MYKNNWTIPFVRVRFPPVSHRSLYFLSFFSFTWSHFAHDLFGIYRHLNFQLLDCVGSRPAPYPLYIRTIWVLLTFLGSFLTFSPLELYNSKIQFLIRHCDFYHSQVFPPFWKAFPAYSTFFFFLLKNVFLISLERAIYSWHLFSWPSSIASMIDYITLYFAHLCKIRRNFYV